jgi:hypothetical protein
MGLLTYVKRMFESLPESLYAHIMRPREQQLEELNQVLQWPRNPSQLRRVEAWDVLGL